MSAATALAMYGTSGATFNVVASFEGGRVGYRSIGTDQYRVRVEPAKGHSFEFPKGWKVPGEEGQNRYSIVVSGLASLLAAISTASAIVSGGNATPPRPLFSASVGDLAINEQENGLLKLGTGGTYSLNRDQVEELITHLNEYVDILDND